MSLIHRSAAELAATKRSRSVRSISALWQWGVCSHPVMNTNPKGNSDQPSKFGFAYGHMFRQTRINTSVTSVHSRILDGLDEIYTKNGNEKTLSLSVILEPTTIIKRIFWYSLV
jgi:isopentenyldiphosphate isomerase